MKKEKFVFPICKQSLESAVHSEIAMVIVFLWNTISKDHKAYNKYQYPLPTKDMVLQVATFNCRNCQDMSNLEMRLSDILSLTCFTFF